MAGLLSIVLGIVQLVLGLRVVFVFFNIATAEAPAIVSLVYNWSVPLVRPFAGLVPAYSLAGFTLDLPAILALVVYAVVGGLLIRLLGGHRGRG